MERVNDFLYLFFGITLSLSFVEDTFICQLTFINGLYTLFNVSISINLFGVQSLTNGLTWGLKQTQTKTPVVR